MAKYLSAVLLIFLFINVKSFSQSMDSAGFLESLRALSTDLAKTLGTRPALGADELFTYFNLVHNLSVEMLTEPQSREKFKKLGRLLSQHGQESRTAVRRRGR